MNFFSIQLKVEDPDTSRFVKEFNFCPVLEENSGPCFENMKDRGNMCQVAVKYSSIIHGHLLC